MLRTLKEEKVKGPSAKTTKKSAQYLKLFGLFVAASLFCPILGVATFFGDVFCVGWRFVASIFDAALSGKVAAGFDLGMKQDLIRIKDRFYHILFYRSRHIISELEIFIFVMIAMIQAVKVNIF